MINKLKNMSVGVKASIVYTLASLFSKGLAIITVPIFTRLMSTEQMGIVSLFNSWQSMLASVVGLALTSGGFMIALKEYEKERDAYTSSVLSLSSAVAILVLVFHIICPNVLRRITGLSDNLIILMLIGFLVAPATEFWLSRQRYEYKYKAAGLMSAGSAIIASLLSALAVVYFSRLNPEDLAEIRLLANYIVIYGIAIIIWVYTLLKGRCFINTSYWKFSLKLSVPLIGNAVAMQILSVSDRTMISKMVGNGKVGIYSVLYTASTLFLIVWGAINTSYVPFLFENIEKKEARPKIQKSASQILFAFGLVALLMTSIAPEIVRILATQEYYEAIYIMPPIAAGVFFTSVSNMYSNILVYFKKTNFIMVSSGFAAGTNLVLNFICIHIWGYMAAAYTTLVAYIILAVMQGVVANSICKKLGTDGNIYNNRSVFIISIFTMLLCLACITLYGNYVVRYGVIVALISVGLICRNKILKLVGLKKE